MTETVSVRMPDGTIIENVPQGTSKSDLEARYNKMLSNRGDGVKLTDFDSEMRDLLTPGSDRGWRSPEEMIQGDFPESLNNAFLSRQEGVDYYTGVNSPGFRSDFSMMDNEKERAAFLDERVGKGNWTQDKYGQYVLNEAGVNAVGGKWNGLPVAIDEHRLTTGDITDLRQDIPAIAGAMIGGWRQKGLKAVGRVMLGAMAGRGAQEGYESTIGMNLQSPWEVALDVGEEGLWAAGGESAVRLGSVVGRKLLGPQSSRMTGVRRSEMENAQDQGIRLWSSQVTDAPLVGRFEKIYTQIFGDSNAAANSIAIHRRMKELKDKAGIGGTLAQTGADLQKALKERLDAFGSLYREHTAGIRSYLSDEASRIGSIVGPQSDNAGIAAVNEIRSSYAGFQTRMRDAYRIIDEAAGKPLYPTAALKQEARDQLAILAKTADSPATPGQINRFRRGGAVEDVAPKSGSAGRPVVASSDYVSKLRGILEMDEYIPLDAAQELRTVFREASYDPNMLGNVPRRQMRMLRQATDAGFDNIDDGGAVSGLLKSARNAYAEGMQMYDDAFIKMITRDSGKAGMVEPSLIVDTMMRNPGRVKSVRTILEKTPEGKKIWQSMAREHYDTAIDNAADLEGFIDPRKLSSQFGGSEAHRQAIREVYGDSVADVNRLIKEVAALDGRIPASALQAGTAKEAIEQVAKIKSEWDSFSDMDWVKQLTKPGAEQVVAVDHIFKKNAPQRIKMAREFYGENSEVWSRTRRIAMKKVLSSVVDDTTDPFMSIFDGQKLIKELDSYGNDALDEMFGEDLRKEIYSFARAVRMATRAGGGSKGAGGIVAAGIAARPLHNLGRLAKIWGTASLMSNKAGLKYMTDGFLSVQKSGGRLTREAAENLARAVVMMEAIGKDDNGDLAEYFGFGEPASPPE